MKKLIVRLLPREGELIPYAVTFLCILAAAKFGQYLFFVWKTSPAILWPPTGIGIAIIWLYGYRYTVPIFAALFVATITGPVSYLVPAIITTPFAQVGGMGLTVYLLRRVGFDGTFSTVRNALAFFIVLIIGCMVAPTVSTLISAFTGNLTSAAYFSWSRSWAGYVFSSLILFPFVVMWLNKERHSSIHKPIEVAFVSVLLVTSVYFLFWTRVPSELSFIIFALFFISNIWACLRFSMRMITTFAIITTVVGILGMFLSPRPGTELSSQLMSIELFLLLVVPIFYTFAALVKERADTFFCTPSLTGKN